MERKIPEKPIKACREDSPLALCREAIAAFDRADGQAPDRLREEVEKAEKSLVRLRDCLIARLRADGGSDIPRRFELDQVNTALTLVAGIEYPSSKVKSSYVESARKLLDRVRRELADLG